MKVFDPKIWGKHLWFVLHSLTFLYNPNEDRNLFKNFFLKELVHIIPCLKCRIHFKKHIKEIPIQLSSASDLSKWLVTIHNKINKDIGKPFFSYEKAKKMYQSKLKMMNNFMRFKEIMKYNLLLGNDTITNAFNKFEQIVFLK